MTKNPNNFTIYVRDENIEKWESISKTFRSDFVNWCLRNKLDEYKEKVTGTAAFIGKVLKDKKI